MKWNEYKALVNCAISVSVALALTLIIAQGFAEWIDKQESHHKVVLPKKKIERMG
jgi:predicted histidine transporter YuiF (NhaC family)